MYSFVCCVIIDSERTMRSHEFRHCSVVVTGDLLAVEGLLNVSQLLVNLWGLILRTGLRKCVNLETLFFAFDSLTVIK